MPRTSERLGTYSSGVCFLLQSSRWKHYTNLIKRSRKQSGVMGKINFQKSRKKNTHQMVLDEEKFVVLFYRFSGCISVCWISATMTTVVNLLVERKFDKVKLIVCSFLPRTWVSFINGYRLSGHQKGNITPLCPIPDSFN